MSVRATIVLFVSGWGAFSNLAIARAQTSLAIERSPQATMTKHVEMQLDALGTFEFVETPLFEVIQYLEDRFKIPMVLDTRALEDDGISSTIAVSANLHDVPLSTFLEITLPGRELRWTVRDGVLVITTPTEEESHLVTRLYPVRDLVLANRLAQIDEDYDTLIEVITMTINPETWDEVG